MTICNSPKFLMKHFFPIRLFNNNNLVQYSQLFLQLSHQCWQFSVVATIPHWVIWVTLLCYSSMGTLSYKGHPWGLYKPKKGFCCPSQLFWEQPPLTVSLIYTKANGSLPKCSWGLLDDSSIRLICMFYF